MPDIKHYLVIKSPEEIIYKAVTEQKGLSSWWTTKTTAKAEVGSISEFKFGNEYYNKMLIISLNPFTKVEWKCVDGDREWIDTLISFELEPQQDKTILRFSQKNWKAETDFFASCNYNWGRYMISLKNYCETGTGAPNTL